MKKFAILANPGHNRVYFETSKTLAIAELKLLLSRLGFEDIEVEGREIAGVYYLTFVTASNLDEVALVNIARLSFNYAIFEILEIAGEVVLKPITLPEYKYVNDNISTILKYTGKTNEIFTRLMLNIGYFSSDFMGQDIRVLDPIAGKGTTLYEALISGFNASGIEIHEQSAQDAYQFMRKYLELEKYKHTTATERISGENKSFKAKKYSINLARNKEDIKANKGKTWEIIAGNSCYADKYFKKNSFELIIGDLPYGVQHGNVGGSKNTTFTRNPKELVENCVEAWVRVLKTGGVLVLAWNNFVLPREEFVEILVNAGLEVLNDGLYLEFEHRVDQAIRRDIIVARRAVSFAH